MLTAESVIEQLGLDPLKKEGGYFRRTWSANPANGHPCTGSAIYFLVTRDQCSALHRLRSDEIWLHHLGDPLELLMLHPDGGGTIPTLGPDITGGHLPQQICPANTWQGARIAPGQERFGFSLCTCVVVPGFKWEDFELGERSSLTLAFPAFSDRIRLLTEED